MTDFKEAFIEKFCESAEIKALLGASASGEDLRYRRIFPFLYDASATQETGGFLCIDTVLQETDAKNYKKLSLTVWSFAHQQELKTLGRNVCDLLLQEAYNLIHERAFHARTLKLSSIEPFRLAEGYRGKRMIFTTTVMDE